MRNKSFFCNEDVRKSKDSAFKSPLEIVKILLRERAMKQTNLADKVGISRQALHHYLSGYWEATVEIKIKIARALEVDSSVIWDLK